MQFASPTSQLNHPGSAGLGGSEVEHPHFLGLAHLRSLLAHEEVATSTERTDAVLDMISVLLQGGSARQAVQAFCKVRAVCQPVCYMALFRLRRWLEQEVTVRVNHGSWDTLRLSFTDYRRLVQNLRREAWEWSDGDVPLQHLEVRFCWRTQVPLRAAAKQNEVKSEA